MNSTDEAADAPYATRIPADISRPDQLLGPFTARQSAVLAAAALVLYCGWWATRPFMAPLTYAALVVPVAGAVAALALGRREGIGLDRFLLAALAHARTPKRRVHAPEGVPPLPAVVPDRWKRAAGPPRPRCACHTTASPLKACSTWAPKGRRPWRHARRSTSSCARRPNSRA